LEGSLRRLDNYLAPVTATTRPFGAVRNTKCAVAIREQHCGAYALWAEAMVQIQKYGTMVKSPTGYLSHAVAVSYYRKQAGRAHYAHCIASRLQAEAG